MGDDTSGTDSVDTLLRKWGLPEPILDRFRENEIKINQLSLLSDDILKEMCPLIGHRLLIKTKLDEFITLHNPGDIQNKIEEVKKIALLNKLSVQPYLIKCDETII